ncbi:Putative secreted protein [Sphingopyxis fribergensis]|uniref:Putative secreted protein n=1 Tax=Sphingopyxis fribergensis TaxID=1515612 RepID=A0A0A7PGV1_9SPHN|nr:PEPxxWA-CTERM sorting domain-containing protein [Sphingopyxis fribergensis]AJA09200.1 Putative secreted protein [Sphingopyxis fribergensis]
MIRAFAAALLVMLFAAPAQADTYTQANFSSGIFGGDANVRDPLLNPYFPSDPFSGSFVYDNNLVPAAGTGFVNVMINSYPDIAAISAADAFKFDFGSYVFTLADDPLAMIQYNNGQFNGFVFNTTFAFEGANYLFNLNGGTLTVRSEADPFGQPYINGYTNIGNGSLTGQTAYTPSTAPPVGAVPEPSTWAMMLLGFGFVGYALRTTRRRRNAVPAFA